MKLPAIVTDKQKRDDFKEKVEVAFAVLTIIGFTYKKIKDKNQHEDSITHS